MGCGSWQAIHAAKHRLLGPMPGMLRIVAIPHDVDWVDGPVTEGDVGRALAAFQPAILL